MSGESRLFVFQEPFPGTFNKQEIVSGTAKFILSLIFDEFGVDILILIFIVEAGIERLGLTNRLQILSQLPSLEDRLDPADEGRDLSPELGVGFSGLEEVQELFPDEVVEGILSAELGLWN